MMLIADLIGAVDGGMGNHLADLNEGEMIVFGSVMATQLRC